MLLSNVLSYLRNAVFGFADARIGGLVSVVLSGQRSLVDSTRWVRERVRDG